MSELKRELKLKEIPIEASSTTITTAQKSGWLSEGTHINSSGHYYLLSRSGAFINPNFQTSLTVDNNASTQFRISSTPAFGLHALAQRILRHHITQEGSLIAIGWQGKTTNPNTNEATNISFGVLQRIEYYYAYPEACVDYPNNLIDFTLFTPRKIIPPGKLTGKEAAIFYNSILGEKVTSRMLSKWHNFRKKHTSLLPCEIIEAIDEAIQDITFSSNYKHLCLQPIC